MDLEKIGEVNFKFSSRFSSLIGRNLISNPIVAVSELVKNAYDADADNIMLTFSNLKSDDSTLVIKDDGEGMSFDDIAAKWMVVGTDNKVSCPYSSKGRRKLGEKGIGRFSVERLAHRLNIYTTQQGKDYALIFDIDWDLNEEAEGEFGDRPYDVFKVNCEEDKQGTVISLFGLRDEWAEDDLLDLRKELNLIRPIDINSVSFKPQKLNGDNVRITLEAPGVLNKSKKIDAELMKYHQAHLFGEINDDGSADMRVTIKSNISISKEEIDQSYHFDASQIDTCCGPITFEGFVFLRDARLYKSLEIEKKNFDGYLDTYCGVKIYRDGFRILPFGDPDNDWLELNAARTASPEHRIGTKNVIGVVHISRDKNIGLQDVLSRENMYDTKEYNALKKFVNKVFDNYTSLQLNARKKKSKEVEDKQKEALNTAKKSLTELSKDFSELKEAIGQTISTTDSKPDEIAVQVQEKLSSLVEKAENSVKDIQKAYTYYRFQDDFKKREIQIYRNIATLGISAAMFGHEALNQTVEANAICKTVLDEYKLLFESNKELYDEMVDLEKDVSIINEKADFFRSYLKREKQDRAKYINIKNVIEQILSQHTRSFDSLGIKREVVFKDSVNLYETWGYEGDFETIFTNLFTNAYKALKNESGDKLIRIEAYVKDENIYIEMLNNGKPIEKDNREKIFQPLFSTYPDGTGLGLTIIQDTVVSYDGSIVLKDDYPLTVFQLVIPKREEPKEDNNEDD